MRTVSENRLRNQSLIFAEVVSLRDRQPVYPSPFHLLITTHSDILQVAITLDYRHQPAARAPIDAGNPVSDNGKVDDYRYYLSCLVWLYARVGIRGRVVSYARHDTEPVAKVLPYSYRTI
jgi:hypothetical protein